MAKVKFYPMLLDFKKGSEIRRLYDLPDEKLSALIFQYEIQDSDGKKEEYCLMAYPLDKSGTIITGEKKIKLYPDTTKNGHKVPNGKLCFANLPYLRKSITEFIEADPSESLINNLYFDPYKYTDDVSDAEYVAYKVYSNAPPTGVIKALVAGDDLKPSPPAIPPALLAASPK